ncbi:hypothetical protein HK44_028420 [Pseudomonas fluorescens HK44]|uniref:Uncharacterized protein n=1 Tax=Pseudomonas fluorescens HK44 TaxID=1042209 RepID=A0A010RRC8_PSEFL|nr:hypothetical protein HK44_028420 [Pseudomonas fluorescens HK44]
MLPRGNLKDLSEISALPVMLSSNSTLLLQALHKCHSHAQHPTTQAGCQAAVLLLLILIHPPLSEGRVEVFIRGWARSAVRRSRTHREEVVAQQTVGDAP